MLAVIDVGNTNIVLGFFAGDSLVARYRLSTRASATSDEYACTLKGLMDMGQVSFQSINAVCLASVVPRLTEVFEDLSKRFFNVSPLIVGPGIKTGISISYESPKDVGADRVVNAAAAHDRFKSNLIVVDFGTATTFDAVTASGVYTGGVIVPGVSVSLDALFLRTAKLPRVEVIRPDTVIGRNTAHSIQSGAYYGYLSMVEGLVARMAGELGGEVKVIATGGLARLVCGDCQCVDEIDPDLALHGLRLIHLRNQSP